MSHNYRFHFMPVSSEYQELIYSWLSKPYVAQWFYGPGLENTLAQLHAFLKGSSEFDYWLGCDGDTPIALFITSYIDKPQDELSTWCTATGAAITLDMLIGDTNYLGKGLSHILIGEFLLRQFPKVSEVLIDPEATNARAIHIYKKAGFVIVGEFIPSHSPHLHYMMKLISPLD